MFRLKSILLIFLFTITYIGCVKKKGYPTTPEIEYKYFTPYVGDSADFSVKFTDGDGDIGVDESDTTKTLYVNYYYKDTITQKYIGYYNPLTNDTLKTGYVVKKPSDAYKGIPITGEVRVRIQKYRHSKKIKNIRYVVYLLDAAGNKSNVITTPDFVVP